MEKKMENEMETLGPFKGVYRDITPTMENQMEKKMENEMETGFIQGIVGMNIYIYRDNVTDKYPPIMENQMEKKMEHEMETRGI